ncbi:hypothetical protein [Natronomonas sp. LN261]|jgi:hypothetical protein|uniref:hypothetical protein n=1 Tax=Natronomonas sp. LN261 TaxID=2750669 RepID=UPI0015EE638A|nr:hypothetical protein [Natronomonas sp. LN261]
MFPLYVLVEELDDGGVGLDSVVALRYAVALVLEACGVPVVFIRNESVPSERNDAPKALRTFR